MWLFQLLFSSLLQLWYFEVRISRSVSESLGIRDNESPLYAFDPLRGRLPPQWNITVKHIQSVTYNQTHTISHIQSVTYNQSHTIRHIQSVTYNQSHTIRHIQSVTYNQSHTISHIQSDTYNQSHTISHIQSDTYNQSQALWWNKVATSMAIWSQR